MMDNAEFGLNAVPRIALEPNSDSAISATVLSDKVGQDFVLSLPSVFLFVFFFSLRLIHIIEGNQHSKITVCVHYMAV